MTPPDPNPTVALALVEDIGSGDLTAALIPESTLAEATVISRENAVLCGAAWFDAVFQQLDPRINIGWQAADGDRIAPDQLLCTLRGPARPLLTGERTALNFLQLLSGVATLARRFADEVAGSGATILDTRKTLPGLRLAQKYAVRCGGCQNHRIGLFDAVLIKNNHVDGLNGDVATAVKLAREKSKAGTFIEIEVRNTDELILALTSGPDAILLDNMSPEELRAAVRLVHATHSKGVPLLEASGGINESNLEAYSKTGVDAISLGALTHSVRAVDLSLRYMRVNR